MRETWVQSLGWEDLLEKEMATHSSILAWKIPQRSLVGYSPWGHKELCMTEGLHFHSCKIYLIFGRPVVLTNLMLLDNRNISFKYISQTPKRRTHTVMFIIPYIKQLCLGCYACSKNVFPTLIRISLKSLSYYVLQ